ncbi:MAG: hypothetical protein GXP30_07250 [Verrucomicrobia bacterium]|nr:hypothetical protein [Verrucomicrobiota bacterium]
MPLSLSRFLQLAHILSVTCYFHSTITSGAADTKAIAPPKFQYAHKEINIPAATSGEKKRREFSLKHALDYLENGAKAWTRERKCIACHTNASYLLTRPALTTFAGKPDSEIRDFFVSELEKFQKTGPAALQRGLTPTKVVYLAAGLAEWDAHVTGTLSHETKAALRLMLAVQSKDGSWGNLDCWPPHESSSFQSTTVAAMALTTAPGWMDEVQTDKTLNTSFEKMKNYLRSSELPHDYARLLLLWSATQTPGLITKEQKNKIQQIVWQHQHSDGGWSIRDFSKPEKWGKGNRAEKLRAEPDFSKPASDGHMTGLSVLVMRACGVPSDDPRIRKATTWLLNNQRESGRW